MIGLKHLPLMLILLVCAFGVYPLKYHVQHLKKQNAALQHKLEAERMNHQLLQAEWAYLNRGDRLQKLARKHLPLVPMRSVQIKYWSDVPMKAEGATRQIKAGR